MHSDQVTTLGELLDEARRISIAEARRRGLSHADAEDAAQTITFRLWQSIKEGKRVKSVEAWTRTATRNYLANKYRDESRLKRGAGLVESLTDVTEDRFARN